MTLTSAQADAARRILAAYHRLNSEHNCPPSRRELAAASGYSLGATTYHLKHMQAAGLIRVEPRQARGIRVVTEGE